jgi:carbamoyl-phosphate synthase small subunit
MNGAVLVLEDGAEFKGESLGIKGLTAGPLFFDTRVVGYQEVMTDPANAGKILMLTYPLIGNYGVNDKFNESAKTWVGGLVIKEESKMYSNWQAQGSLDDFLKKEKLVAITEVDTRTLAVHLRDKGEMWAAISTNGKSKEALLKQIKILKHKTKSRMNDISTKETRVISGKTKMRVGVLDLGVLKSLIVQLQNLGLEIAILPFNTQPAEIFRLKLNGLIISNGPEDDPISEEIIPIVKHLVGKIPILGIALGCQLIAKSLGAKTKRMHLGHHGVNYPIKYSPSFSRSAIKIRDGIPPGAGKGEITVQNHSWVIDLNSLRKVKDIEITALNLNDETAEEFVSKKYKIIAVQYYPASPGFDEVNSTLIKFLQLMKGKR